MSLLEVVREGVRIYDLARPLENGMPCSPSHPGFRFALIRRHGDRVNPDGMSGSNELIMTGGHVGTHIDALAHVAHNGKLHGGLDALAAARGGRYTHLGVDEIAPMVCRGLLLDVAAARGVAELPPGYGITEDDLARALGEQELGQHDVVLVRTGWSRRYPDADAYIGHTTGVPGVTESAARWLGTRGIRTAGIDTIAFDQILPKTGHTRMPAHRVLLVEYGIPIIEVLNLDELATAGVAEFVFVLAPLRITGGTGSPVRPLAVVSGLH